MRLDRRLALVVGGLAFLAYVGTLGYPLLWDDLKVLPLVRASAAEGGLSNVLAWDYRLDADIPLGYYRPVASASLLADDALGAGRAWSFHLTNVLLNVACSVLVFFLGRSVGAASWPAAAGAALFALHPVHVEAVAFVSGRTDLWATVLALGAALCWRRAGREAGLAPLVVVGGAALFGLALLAKESAVALPAALLSWDLISPEESASRRDRWKRLAPRLVSWGAAMAVVVVLRWAIAGVGLEALHRAAAMRDPSNVGWSPGLVPGIVSLYLRLLLVPWPLNAYYTPDLVALRPWAWLCAVALLGLLVVPAPWRRRGAASLAWIVLCLTPVLGFVPIAGAVAAERFLYLPSVGLALFFALGPASAFGRRPGTVGAITALAILTLGVGTLARSPVWADEVRLFSDTESRSPRWEGAPYNLGVALQELGDRAGAMAAFERAVRVRPEFAEAWNNLGIVYQAAGRFREAVEAHRRATQLRTGYVGAHNNLGNALAAAGRLDEALAAYGEAVRLAPNLAPARFNLGLAYLRTRNLAAAEEQATRLRDLDPSLAAALEASLRGSRGPAR